MKIHNVIIGKENVTQVFVGKDEIECEVIKTEIQEIKNKSNKVVLFIGGQNEIMTSVKAMLQLVAV